MKTLMSVLVVFFGTMMGVFAQTTTSVKVSDLPKAITENLSMQHKDWMPAEAFKMDSKGTISYEVVAKKGTNVEKFYYDNNGRPMMKPMMAKAEHHNANSQMKHNSATKKSGSGMKSSNMYKSNMPGTKKAEKK